MTTRFLCAASVIALVSACSDAPGPSSLGPVDQGYDAYRAGNYAVAEQAYGGALSVDPSNAKAMLGLAEVYEQTGRTAEAADLYRRVDAAQSGTIRVWTDGGMMQDGVTEVAGRRLGALGEPTLPGVQRAVMPAHAAGSTGLVAPVMAVTGGSHAAKPMMAAPAYSMPAPTVVSAPAGYGMPAPAAQFPDNPVYALDEDGMVYYADPEATQPINETVYETPEAAMGGMVPASLAPTMAAPVYAAPTPAIQYQPAPMQYEAAPAQYQPAPMQYEAAPAQYQPAPMQYEPAPMMAPAQPVSYTPAPMTYTPAPSYTPAPRASAPTYAPTPQSSAVRSAPVSSGSVQQPGYGVIDGNFVYISAEDIAAGATAPTPTPAGPAAEGYGVPVPVSSSAIPVGTPEAYSAPRGVDVMNGIPMINLN